jgi:hypothetical protein
VIAPYGQRTQFTDQPIGPAVGSDGARVAAQTGDLKFHKPSLRIVDAATGAVAQSFGSTGVAAPTYSADGSALYAITRISIQKVADTVTHPARLNRHDWVSATNSSKPWRRPDPGIRPGAQSQPAERLFRRLTGMPWPGPPGPRRLGRQHTTREEPRLCAKTLHWKRTL